MESYGVDYAGLKTGLYLQVGTNIKALDVNRGADNDILAAFGFGRHVRGDELADKEAWTFTALSRRSEWLQGVPHSWKQNDNEMDDAPYNIDMRSLLSQLDKALQIKKHGAFLYKVRGLGKQIVKLVWLDPDTITPDLKTSTHEDGITRFSRKNDNGRDEWVDAAELIWFKRPGMKELQSDPAPLEASRKAAEVLYNMQRMEDFFFEGAGMPIMLVMIGGGVSDKEKEEMRSRFQRLANALRNTREIRTMAVRDGVSVQQLSFSPKDLDLGPSEERNRNKVLGVHQVPQSVAMSNAANFATASSDQVQFANTMATRLEAIAETFNADEDVMADGYSLVVNRNEMPSLQEEEASRAQAFSQLVAGGVHPLAAMAMLGYDLPEGYDGPVLVEDEPEPVPQMIPVPQMPSPNDDEEVKSVMWHDDEKRLKRWLTGRGPDADVNDFNSNELDQLDKLEIYTNVFGGENIYSWRNYPSLQSDIND